MDLLGVDNGAPLFENDIERERCESVTQASIEFALKLNPM